MFVPELRKAATMLKVGSNPVRVVSLLEEGDKVTQREATPAKVVGKPEFHETFTRSPFGCYGLLLWSGACLKNLTTPDPNP